MKDVNFSERILKFCFLLCTITIIEKNKRFGMEYLKMMGTKNLLKTQIPESNHLIRVIVSEN